MSIETIDIKVVGVGAENRELSVENHNYDLSETIEILQIVKSIIEEQCKDRPIISYQPLNGSVIHRFATQAFAVNIFAHTIDDVNTCMDNVDPKTAKQIERLQSIARTKNRDIKMTTSLKTQKTPCLHINKDTNFVVTNYNISKSEFYFYGTVVNSGGKTNPNIHLDTKDYGTVIISTPSEIIAQYQKSGQLIHKENVCIKAIANQNMATGTLSNIQFQELISYSPTPDKLLIIQQSLARDWHDIDNVEQFVKDIRHII